MEAPHLQNLNREYFRQGLRVIGVAPLGGPVVELHGFVRRHGLSYPVLVDPEERVVKRYGLEAYPATVLMDRNGVVRWLHQGFRPSDAAVMKQRVSDLLRSR